MVSATDTVAKAVALKGDTANDTKDSESVQVPKYADNAVQS